MPDPCLNCTLPICDERDARCAFVQITVNGQRRRLEKQYRDALGDPEPDDPVERKKWLRRNQARRYRARHHEQINAAVKARRDKDREKYNAYMRAFYRGRKR